MARKRPAKKPGNTGKVFAPVPFDVARMERRHKLQVDEIKASLAAAHMAVDRLEREKDVLLALDDRPAVARWAKPSRVDKGEAVGLLLLSDWHPGQVVTLQETNGLNEWGPDHCTKAARMVVDKTCGVHLPRYRTNARIDELVVWIGGDMIEGHNRDEQKARNAMTPIREAQFAEGLLERVLLELCDRAAVKRITVVTSTGNHDRTTEKMWAAGRNDTSYATLIYDHLRKTFKNHRKVQWQAEQGEMSYLDVFDWKCRFVHGDSIKYRGGRDGLSGPAMIQIRKWNDANLADYTFFGDKHTYLANDQCSFVANGALCGPAAYSLRYGANVACQAFAVIDRSRGMTDATRVFCR